jgi:hypothetical protein
MMSEAVTLGAYFAFVVFAATRLFVLRSMEASVDLGSGAAETEAGRASGNAPKFPYFG